MSDHSIQGPERIPPGAMYFLYTIASILAVLIAGWILKDI